jgi:hypothetical protein
VEDVDFVVNDAAGGDADLVRVSFRDDAAQIREELNDRFLQTTTMLR